jgi:acyl-CoA reductase-like NAD-dependent aldehyde dehydrogenase
VPSDLSARAAAARESQPYWALLQAAARARYLRRAAVALLDEVEELAELLARDAGLPRTEALLAELLPTVSGLHALADHGPSALAAERLGRVPALRAGRRTILLRSPRGLVGVRAAEDAPFAEPALEVAAAVLAGNAVLLASSYGAAATRLVAALERAGLPEGLVQALPADADLGQACDHVVGGPATGPKATMLVLAGAELATVVPGALWAAYAAAGRHPAAVGRIVTVPSVAPALLVGLQAAAGRLRVGDPLRPETEVGPLRSEPQARPGDRRGRRRGRRRRRAVVWRARDGARPSRPVRRARRPGPHAARRARAARARSRAGPLRRRGARGGRRHRPRRGP